MDNALKGAKMLETPPILVVSIRLQMDNALKEMKDLRKAISDDVSIRLQMDNALKANCTNQTCRN